MKNHFLCQRLSNRSFPILRTLWLILSYPKDFLEDLFLSQRLSDGCFPILRTLWLILFYPNDSLNDSQFFSIPISISFLFLTVPFLSSDTLMNPFLSQEPFEGFFSIPMTLWRILFYLKFLWWILSYLKDFLTDLFLS